MTHPFFSDSLVRALGWTLAHSLWQGALAAIVVWFWLPRLRSAQGRYRASFGALLLVFVAAIATFSMIYEKSGQAEASPAGQVFSENLTAVTAQIFPENLPDSPLWQRTADWLEGQYPLLVSVWLAGFAFFLVRLGGGLFFVRQMRTRQVRPVPEFLEKIAARLLAEARVSRPVALLESGLATTPMLIGYLKPVVLLPASLLAQLSPAEMEAVLAHEFAHIARRDWILNLVQAFIETVFYYHPAIWWLSGVARAERENCCDDFAVGLTGDRLFFAKTLLRVQELARAEAAGLPGFSPALALGFAGEKSGAGRRFNLLRRVQRLLNQSTTKNSVMEKMTAAGILLALLGLLAVRAQSTPTILNTLKDWAEAPVEFWENGFVDEPRTMTVTVTDSLPPGKKSVSKISSDDGTRKVEMTLENGQITQLNVDGKDIPPADFGKYDDLTEELRGESPEPPEAPEAPNFDRRAMSPMPPMPGMPPMAGMPPMPPMPAMAPMPGMPPMPPMPGFAPHAFAWGEGAGRTARVYTEKDSSGATVVRIEHGGEPTVLRVQDGAVFINGEKVANGQRISLGNGQALAFGDDVVLSDGDALAPEAFAYSFSSDDGRLQEIGALADAHLADSREHLKELRKELKLQEKELKKQQKAMKKDQKRHMAEAERALAEARRETETAVRASESDHRQAEREARTAQREAETARRDNETSRRDSEISRRDSEASRRMALEAQARAEQFTATMVENLVRDGILTDAKNYSIQFSKKKLVVNGKPQSAEVLAKYLKIFAEREGRDMGDNESYSWEE